MTGPQEVGDVCAAHKLLHSLERVARKFGRAEHRFENEDRLIVYSEAYRWWRSLALEAGENGLAYGYHMKGAPASTVGRDAALRWLRDSLVVESC
jgi:hypothetical protein